MPAAISWMLVPAPGFVTMWAPVGKRAARRRIAGLEHGSNVDRSVNRARPRLRFHARWRKVRASYSRPTLPDHTMDHNRQHVHTLIAQALGRVAEPFAEIAPPIHVSTTYERAGDGAYPGGRVYSRADN